MKIICETSLENFNAWSGAKDTLNRIIEEGKCNELEAILESEYPDGMTDTELNDLLWFESDLVYEWVGIRTESEIQSELDEAKEELEEAQEELDAIMKDYQTDCEEMEEEIEDKESFENAKYDLWHGEYKYDVEKQEERIKELEERIEELEEELENI